jgi:hypothetical protein
LKIRYLPFLIEPYRDLRFWDLSFQHDWLKKPCIDAKNPNPFHDFHWEPNRSKYPSLKKDIWYLLHQLMRFYWKKRKPSRDFTQVFSFRIFKKCAVLNFFLQKAQIVSYLNNDLIFVFYFQKLKHYCFIKNTVSTINTHLKRPSLYSGVSVFVPSPSPFRHHPVTVPSLGVLNRPTSLTVLNRPLPLFVLRTLKDGLGRLRTGRWRDGDGMGTERWRWRDKNADSAVS